MQEVTIVVPCYDEQGRIDPGELARLARAPGVRLVLVDDGSRDDTRGILEGICREADATLVALESNSGKGEAVRRGLLAALAAGAELVGYVDADLSTPVDEVLGLVDRARTSGAEVVMGSRVALSGHDIRRKTLRHDMGRAFATLASLALGATIYDTQCGAKILRRSTALEGALAEPFASRWAFDVELLDRLLAAGVDAHAILEVPLGSWSDVPGSKLRPLDVAHAGLDLARIALGLTGGVRAGRGRGSPR
jgi:dolichyl-phosphate beta-glucosyltransferase